MDFSASPASDAAATATFASHWISGNRVELAAERGPFLPMLTLRPEMAFALPASVVRLLQAMATLQERTPEDLYVPDLAELTGEQAREIFSAADLVRGKALPAQWHELELDQPVDDALLDREGQGTVQDNYEIRIGDRTFFLGVTSTQLDSVTIADGVAVATGTAAQAETKTTLIVPGTSAAALVSLDVSAERLPGAIVRLAWPER